MDSHSVKTYTTEEVEIAIDDRTTIKGNMSLVQGASGIVLFAHGSGSGRFSPRNRYVASVLEQAELSTLLIDLLTEKEELIDLETRELRFDIELLVGRVVAVTKWLLQDERIKGVKVGYFGASTGAAAVLAAAAELGDVVKAVVSRGGRPDLAGDALPEVKAPTLLIVGGNDSLVIDLNERAADMLTGDKKIEIVPGATHLFEEAGALERVAELAGQWFNRYLC